MMNKLLSVSLFSAMVLFLTGCYELDADISIDADGMIDGSIVIEFDPSSDFNLEDFVFFPVGEEPNGLVRQEIDEPDRQAILLSFRNHPATEKLQVLNPLQDEVFIYIAGEPDTSDLLVHTTSLTESFCAQDAETFAAFQEAWDVQVTIEFARGKFLGAPSSDRVFTQVVEDGGVIVWRPSFGMDDDFSVNILDPVSPRDGDGPELLDYVGCGEASDYSDLASVYPAPRPSPTESEPAEEPTEDVVAEDEVQEEQPVVEGEVGEVDSTETPVAAEPSDQTEESPQSSIWPSLLIAILVVVVLALAGLVIYLLRGRKAEDTAQLTEEA